MIPGWILISRKINIHKKETKQKGIQKPKEQEKKVFDDVPKDK